MELNYIEPDYWAESNRNKRVEMITGVREHLSMENGDTLCKDYGKYGSRLLFVIPKDVELQDPEFKGNILKERNIECDGSVKKIIQGTFFVTKKGSKAFRVTPEGEHELLVINWGGSFCKTRGATNIPDEDRVYFHRASSNGGGTGYTFIIVPKDFRVCFTEDDI